MSPSRNRGTVLLADDEDVVRLVARRLLERLGFEVVDVPNGRAAVDAAAAAPSRYCLALFDVSMPILGGADATVEIRHVAPDLPVILMSGSTVLDLNDSLGAAQPDAFLEKPFTLAELEAILRQVLAGSA